MDIMTYSVYYMDNLWINDDYRSYNGQICHIGHMYIYAAMRTRSTKLSKILMVNGITVLGY